MIHAYVRWGFREIFLWCACISMHTFRYESDVALDFNAHVFSLGRVIAVPECASAGVVGKARAIFAARSPFERAFIHKMIITKIKYIKK